MLSILLFPFVIHHLGGSDDKESSWKAGDSSSIPGLERFPVVGNDNVLQYSCLKIPCTEEPGGLQSMGSQRVRHNLMTEQNQGSVQAFYLSYPHVSSWGLLEKHYIAMWIWSTGAVSRDFSFLVAFLIIPDSLFLFCLLSPVFVFVCVCGCSSVIKLRCHQQTSWTISWLRKQVNSD